MARNNPKPTDKTEWDATGNINSPSAGRKTSGWLFSVKPPAEMFNWFWNLTGLNQIYHNAQVQDWIVIDSDADEGDYATLTAYLADAPAAGNRVLIKEDQTVTVQTVIPDDVTLKFLDGSRLLCATDIATSVLQFGSDIVIEGVLNVVLSQTGVTAKAVELNGDNVTGKINIENSSTGTLTTGYHINASKTGNKVDGFIDNTGGGTLTNEVVDNSTEDSNSLIIVDGVNNIVIATGLVDFSSAQALSNKTLASPIINTPSSSGHVYSGTYTPTLTGINNVSTVTIREAFYTRTGNIVSVSGILTAFDVLTVGLLTSFRLTLPVSSNLGSFWDLSGNASSNPVNLAIDPMAIVGDTANDEASFDGILNGSSVLKQTISYSFSYEVL